jgi:crotonobetainyl-CoA:carnitine CoA-transferase CaiB-like acyl-CoA transferase
VDAPLAGIRVVNIGVNVPAGVATARLVELGASATKVEPPAGDPLQAAAPDLYEHLAAGQEIVRLNLKDDAERAGFAELLDASDVLLTSSRPLALVKLGLDAAALEVSHPRLVAVAIVGYGEPEEGRAGHDLTYLAGYGLVSPPDLPRTLVADLGGAERAVTAACVLLLARERGIQSRHAEVRLADAAEAFALPWTYGLTVPGGILGGGFPFYGLYEADGGWIALAALEPHFQNRLVQVLGVEPTRESLAAAFGERTPEEWERWGKARDVPIAAVAATIHA